MCVCRIVLLLFRSHTNKISAFIIYTACAIRILIHINNIIIYFFFFVTGKSLRIITIRQFGFAMTTYTWPRCPVIECCRYCVTRKSFFFVFFGIWTDLLRGLSQKNLILYGLRNILTTPESQQKTTR